MVRFIHWIYKKQQIYKVWFENMQSIYPFTYNQENLDKEVLGNKGYNLLKLYQKGINVPRGFILTPAAKKQFFTDSFQKELKQAVEELRQETETSKLEPLIVSVRSGASVSMPGMLDTILNVGITEKKVESSKQEYLAEGYLNFLENFSKAVYNIDLSEKEAKDPSDPLAIFEQVKQKKEELQTQLSEPFEDVFFTNLSKAILAVFDSWHSPKAVGYRKKKGISDELSTAVVVQEMKFGNFNKYSGTGIVFTKNPFTGVEELYGEYLVKQQGDAVVSGIVNTKPIQQLNIEFPAVYQQLEYAINQIKEIYTNPQDIEFTFEDGELFILQTRDIRFF